MSFRALGRVQVRLEVTWEQETPTSRDIAAAIDEKVSDSNGVGPAHEPIAEIFDRSGVCIPVGDGGMIRVAEPNHA